MQDVKERGQRKTSQNPPSLAGADLSLRLKKKAYRKRLKHAQHQLFTGNRRCFELGVPVIIVFEGWDAAGKGSVIKRINEHLDPRGFHVYPTGAPNSDEKAHHYLRRFWLRLPSAGHIAVFDRSWYGRVLVERVEAFASDNEWQRAYDEINNFESLLVHSGTIIRKYFLHIDAQTQLERFDARKDNPLKSWKLTPEDWRNRDKWACYESATEDMLARTHHAHAPWMVVPSTCKRHARVQVVEDLAQTLHAHADALEA
ncbi:MAG: UDP-galactose-lipid carrier transferase [Planctomycetota bacterium]|nr:MAG: UDP-galactose-lipid carrier transferase [Planctomycetota bacterium]